MGAPRLRLLWRRRGQRARAKALGCEPGSGEEGGRRRVWGAPWGLQGCALCGDVEGKEHGQRPWGVSLGVGRRAGEGGSGQRHFGVSFDSMHDLRAARRLLVFTFLIIND